MKITHGLVLLVVALCIGNVFSSSSNDLYGTPGHPNRVLVLLPSEADKALYSQFFTFLSCA